MIRKCIICFSQLTTEASWSTIFLPSNETMCHKCKAELMFIHTNTCSKCGRESVEEYCFDCIRWSKLYKGCDVLDKNISLFSYNDFLQEVIYTWKYRLDYHIVEAFRYKWKKRFKRMLEIEVNEKLNDITIVPIPLSKERLEERGYNQAEQLAEMLDGNIEQLFRRVASEKQAKKNRMQRLQTKNPFTLIKNCEGTIILIDDIYTTGRTIRHAAKLCKMNGCKAVYSFTLCRS